MSTPIGLPNGRGSEAHRSLALRGAQSAITLLKNEKNLLPLKLKKLKTIAVIGPNADRSLLGGYSGIPNIDVIGARWYQGPRESQRKGSL